ncbi:CMGC/DYRK/PRP4 protein kinase [Salpingoeca rosetta]|uniref:Serine/threonine-protein kinase PRP4 homolog n=1 Tax=Salpingoeca rosetta (strain ATCC 50818 / BSB-021) TaxID=946362 RepID=F2TVW5_SALR5|nr:CMGC/DYRK/PRP4 protein kinase [Salpingoeca rosetta]EGD72211.1 CMGC/DYRK/PRP4 protein kinase [Salpingoeca rosetta]|eukprot:XP_004998782.1 CMGC/DYRK/PRP4 protein kinase [Salpingoeca rosetta]
MPSNKRRGDDVSEDEAEHAVKRPATRERSGYDDRELDELERKRRELRDMLDAEKGGSNGARAHRSSRSRSRSRDRGSDRHGRGRRSRRDEERRDADDDTIGDGDHRRRLDRDDGDDDRRRRHRSRSRGHRHRSRSRSRSPSRSRSRRHHRHRSRSREGSSRHHRRHRHESRHRDVSPTERRHRHRDHDVVEDRRRSRERHASRHRDSPARRSSSRRRHSRDERERSRDRRGRSRLREEDDDRRRRRRRHDGDGDDDDERRRRKGNGHPLAWKDDDDEEDEDLGAIDLVQEEEDEEKRIEEMRRRRQAILQKYSKADPADSHPETAASTATATPAPGSGAATNGRQSLESRASTASATSATSATSAASAGVKDAALREAVRSSLPKHMAVSSQPSSSSGAGSKSHTPRPQGQDTPGWRSPSPPAEEDERFAEEDLEFDEGAAVEGGEDDAEIDAAMREAEEEMIKERFHIDQSALKRTASASSASAPAAAAAADGGDGSGDGAAGKTGQDAVAQAGKKATTEAGGGGGEGGDEEGDDMFSENFDVTAAATTTAATTSSGSAALSDNHDDAEGYYRYKFSELLDARYKVYGYTGKGVFSNVVRARDIMQNDTPVAIKIIRNNDIMYKAAIKELEVIHKLQDKDPSGRYHCVRFLRSFRHKNHLCLVFEHMSMNLREVQRRYGRNKGLSLKAVQAYAHQLLLSLHLLRKCAVIHADIKPDNILANEAKNVIKLCDFGSALYTSEAEVTPLLVSRFYRAPEIMLGCKYGCPIDMWSVACTLYELWTGTILFKGRDNNEMLKLIFALKGKPANKMIRQGMFKDQHFTDDFEFKFLEQDKVTQQEKVTLLKFQNPTTDLKALLLKNQSLTSDQQRHFTNFRDLLDKMLIVDPDKRISVRHALRHPFITEQI